MSNSNIHTPNFQPNLRTIEMQRKHVFQATLDRLQRRIASNAFNDTCLPFQAKVDMALHKVHVALLRYAYKPNSLFLTLCTHPLHLLLWSDSPSRKMLHEEVARKLETHEEPLELRSLAQALRLALPHLDATFENAQLPEQVWIEVCRKMLVSPIPGNALVHLSGSDLYCFQEELQSAHIANSIWFALTRQQKSEYLSVCSSLFPVRCYKRFSYWLKSKFNRSNRF